MRRTREEEMKASDVFDMLVSCADFETFKDLMLSHKSMREVCILLYILLYTYFSAYTFLCILFYIYFSIYTSGR